MKEKLEEVERNMRSILKEVNKTFGAEYRNFEASLWPTRSESFKINLWDGLNHAPLNRTDYAGTPEELIEWITKRKRKRKILFQKFDKVL